MGIRCNAILPGGMSTNIGSAFQAGLNQKGYELMMKGMATGPEMCDLSQIAKTAVFLSLPESSVVNGAVISTDNGWLAV